MLPLMYWLELRDIMFLVKHLKQPQDNFNIRDHVRFVTTSTRLGSNLKLSHNFTRLNKTRHYYFNRVVRLWNAMPSLDLEMSYRRIERLLFNFFWDYFNTNFDPDNLCTYHVICLAPIVLFNLIKNPYF